MSATQQTAKATYGVTQWDAYGPNHPDLKIRVDLAPTTITITYDGSARVTELRWDTVHCVGSKAVP